MTDAIHARAIVVLGDCHIHPAKGVDWPLLALDAFKGADLFVTLGDMGESRPRRFGPPRAGDRRAGPRRRG
jgi:hypothetical protein